jgi:hypothetical protein
MQRVSNLMQNNDAESQFSGRLDQAQRRATNGWQQCTGGRFFLGPKSTQ